MYLHLYSADGSTILDLSNSLSLDRLNEYFYSYKYRCLLRWKLEIVSDRRFSPFFLRLFIKKLKKGGQGFPKNQSERSVSPTEETTLPYNDPIVIKLFIGLRSRPNSCLEMLPYQSNEIHLWKMVT